MLTGTVRATCQSSSRKEHHGIATSTLGITSCGCCDEDEQKERKRKKEKGSYDSQEVQGE